MKIIDAVKNHKKGLFEIPNVNRMDLPEFCVQMGYKVGVEIGVDKAIYLNEFLKAGLKMFGVDPHKYYGDYPHPKGQKRLDFLHEHCKRVIAPYGDKAILIRKTSVEAAEDFADNSIDFVYIDGHHGFKYVAEDLWEWTKKVRPGGMIAGHDFALTRHSEIRDPFVLHVKHVILAWVACFRIKRWFLLGAAKGKIGEKRDMFRSWFWIRE